MHQPPQLSQDVHPDGCSQVTLLHQTAEVSILHKPAGMPVSGNKTRTLLKTPHLQHKDPRIIAAVPRPISGPAVVTLKPSIHVPLTIHFTFFAILHCPHDRLPRIADSVVHQSTTPSVSGPLSAVLIRTTAPGQGLRKRLLRAGAPAVGTTADTRKTRCATRGLYIACTRLEIPTLGIDISLPLPSNFSTLLEREERYALKRMKSAQQRVLADGPSVRFLDRFFCTRGTMQPRESTEIVARTAADCLRRASKPGYAPRILDLGTGSGAILISVLLETEIGTGVGVDNSMDALRTANRNVKDHGLRNVHIRHMDFGQLRDIGLFEVVVSNPPYLTEWEVRKDACFFQNEPKSAFLAGEDGLYGYRSIANSIGNVLADDGVVVLEIGHRRDVTAVRALFENVGLVFVDLIKDFKGFDRCLVLRKPR